MKRNLRRAISELRETRQGQPLSEWTQWARGETLRLFDEVCECFSDDKSDGELCSELERGLPGIVDSVVNLHDDESLWRWFVSEGPAYVDDVAEMFYEISSAHPERQDFFYVLGAVQYQAVREVAEGLLNTIQTNVKA
jgi:hypothetical protein